eukprot:TRINITY_DN1802_c0_g2_i15.p1 TRINITY_DN1802_c0_g2~~TRINITY_DN1802_c0_g2_i15.p1  ORF type:complete len:526 (+),score=160.84 TRINITY_DN1802_c0_g2_i15:148-1725(+)
MWKTLESFLESADKAAADAVGTSVQDIDEDELAKRGHVLDRFKDDESATDSKIFGFLTESSPKPVRHDKEEGMEVIDEPHQVLEGHQEASIATTTTTPTETPEDEFDEEKARLLKENHLLKNEIRMLTHELRKLSQGFRQLEEQSNGMKKNEENLKQALAEQSAVLEQEEEQISMLKKKIEAINSELQTAISRRDAAELQYKTADSELKLAQQDYQKWQLEAAHLRQEVEDHVNKNIVLVNEVASLTRAHEKEMVELREELERVKEDMKEEQQRFLNYKAKASLHQKSLVKREGNADNNPCENSENISFTDQLALGSNETLVVLQFKALKQENESLLSNINSLRSEMENEIRKTKSEIFESQVLAQEENKDLRNQLLELSQFVTQQEAIIKGKDLEIQNLRKHVSELERFHSEQIARVRQEKTEEEKAVQRLQLQLEAKQLQFSSSTEVGQRLRDMATHLMQKQETIEELRSECESLKDRLVGSSSFPSTPPSSLSLHLSTSQNPNHLTNQTKSTHENQTTRRPT